MEISTQRVEKKLPKIVNMVLYVALFFTLLVNLNCEIVQLQFLSRHCDRTCAWNRYTYLKAFPETTHINQILNTSYGELTPLGHRECYLLGTNLRSRYFNDSSVNNIANLSRSYESKDFHFSATSFDRTVISGYSISLGLFPLFEGRKIDVGPYKGHYSYPSGEQAVPYFTTENENSILFAMDTCNTAVQNRHYSNFPQFWEDHLSEISDFSNRTGNEIDSLIDFYYLWDFCHVLDYHNRLPDHVKEIWDSIYELGQLTFNVFYSRQTLSNLGGGPFLQNMLDNMGYFVQNTDDSKKFMHYSAHDTTLIAVLAAMDILDAYEELKGMPRYGSVILFELHEDVKDEYYVKLFFKHGWYGEYIPLKLKDCDEKCDYDKFTSLIKDVGIPDDWCTECGNKKTNSCLQKSNEDLEKKVDDAKKSRDSLFIITLVLGLFLVFLILLIIVILFVYICEKRILPSHRPKRQKNEYTEVN